MKCPNCGNEAINVNGKYVCLDCGVEITAENQNTSQVFDPGPVISNHIEPTPAVPSEQPTEEAFSPATDVAATPVESAPESIPQNPVKEDYLREIENENPTSGTDFSTPDKAPLPDFPVGDGPKTDPFPENVNYSGGLPLNISPDVTEEPKQELAATPEFVPAPAAPEPTSYFQPSEINIKPNPGTAVSDAPVESPIEAPFSAEPTADFSPVENEPTSIVPEISAPESAEASNEVPAPELPVEPQIIASEVIGVEPETNPEVSPVLTATVPTETEIPINIPAQVSSESANASGLDLDTLLDKYSGGQGSGMPPVSPGNLDGVKPAVAPEAPSTIPGANSIPSAASVFADGLEDPTAQMEAREAKQKKLKIYIGIGVGIFLVFVVLIAFVVSQQNSANSRVTQLRNLTKQIQEGAAQKIDEPQDLKVTFKETIDLSNLSVKSKVDPTVGQGLLTLFKTPYLNEGNWQTNNEGDLSQNNRAGSQNQIRTYIETEKMTYVSENGKWGKTEGRQIVGVPVFFNPIERGSLFYDSKVDRVSYLKKEADENGTEIYLLRIYPKEDLIKEVLNSTSPLIAKANFESINTEGLEIKAKVDAENNLLEVTIAGTVTVKADLFEGTININANANYNYGSSEIEKPVAAQTEPLIILSNTIIQSDFPKQETVEQNTGRG